MCSLGEFFKGSYERLRAHQLCQDDASAHPEYAQQQSCTEPPDLLGKGSHTKPTLTHKKRGWNISAWGELYFIFHSKRSELWTHLHILKKNPKNYNGAPYLTRHGHWTVHLPINR